MVPIERPSTHLAFPSPGLAAKHRGCAVCGSPSQETHFGVITCRACAAFFRRTVAMQLKYVCRLSNKCETTSALRSICRACRYRKCLKVGMKKTAVQRYVDRLDSEQPNRSGFHEISDLPTILSKELGMPTLLHMAENYKLLENGRKIVHNRNCSAINKPQPQIATYSQANEINVKEIDLVANFVAKSFIDLKEHSVIQKRNLFRAFLRKFIVLEAGYFGALKKQREVFILPSGDYIQLTKPETFFSSSELREISQMTHSEAIKMFGDIFDKHRRCVLVPMNELALDEIEFLALVSILFWDLDDETKECEETATVVRKKIINELVFYHRYIKMLREPAARLAPIMAILPQLQRVVNRMQEDMALNHAFDVFDVEETFRRVINCTF